MLNNNINSLGIDSNDNINKIKAMKLIELMQLIEDTHYNKTSGSMGSSITSKTIEVVASEDNFLHWKELQENTQQTEVVYYGTTTTTTKLQNHEKINNLYEIVRSCIFRVKIVDSNYWDLQDNYENIEYEYFHI